MILGYAKRFRWQIAIGTVLFVAACVAVLAFIMLGYAQKPEPDVTKEEPVQATTPEALVARRLDGVLVPSSIASLAPRAVIVENHPEARPVSGLSRASIVFEAPVEGGITRFLALFPSSSTIEQIGPVRSARPYYVDWADAWNASFFHVGGSPEALEKISVLKDFVDVNEFFQGDYFWRDKTRFAPHNVYTKSELMDAVLEKKLTASSTAPLAWRFQDMASTTDRGDAVSIRIPYGGNYNVRWSYDKDRGVYTRYVAGVAQNDRDDSAIETENVIVIKTEQQILDSYGRLRIRTTGNGEAVAYRDGKRFVLRWRRSIGEPMRFESSDGTEFIFTRGRTWIQVTTSDTIFAGLDTAK